MGRVAALTNASSCRPIPLRTGPHGRHLVDVTLLFTPTSGGVRRYLLAKHHWLRQHSHLHHTVLVPGRDTAGARLAPDLIEVGDPYQLAWQSLRVARERRYSARLYAGFDRVLAPSATVAERLADAGVGHVEIQRLGADVEILTPQARDPGIRSALGVPADARLLVFAGRMSREKRTRDLVAARRLLGPAYHLLLVGGSRAGPLGRNVTALEYQQDPRQLARILASADAFVHAGDQETFGLVVLEAMACGLPVVAARAGALTELVDASVGATFRARDPGDLARAIRALFECDRDALGRAARARAEAHSWDRAFTQLLGRYTRLMPPRDRTVEQARHAG